MKQVICKEAYIQNWKDIGEWLAVGCTCAAGFVLLIVGVVPLVLCGIFGLYPED